MKDGSKVASRAPTTAGSSLPASLAIAIPYPPGLSAIVAEEVQLVPHFTPREKDVGGWIAEGKTDTEIASILGRALETVKTHSAKRKAIGQRRANNGLDSYSN